MDEEAVYPQAESIEQMIDQADADVEAQEGNEQAETTDKTMIPLSVAQKLREKKRELELELQWERQERQRLMTQSAPQKPTEEDNSRFESATREDLSRAQQEAIRVFEERQWIKNNPEKFERINEYLPTFLKQRPNLTQAIQQSTNRYEEAYTLMEALTPKQKTQLSKDVKPPKKEAPNSPGSVPKAAAMNEAVDVMNMSDKEFAEWRATKRKRR